MGKIYFPLPVSFSEDPWLQHPSVPAVAAGEALWAAHVLLVYMQCAGECMGSQGSKWCQCSNWMWLPSASANKLLIPNALPEWIWRQFNLACFYDVLCEEQERQSFKYILDAGYKKNRDKNAVFSPFGHTCATKDIKSGLFSDLGVSSQYGSYLNSSL